MKTYKARKGKFITVLMILTALIAFIGAFNEADNFSRMMLTFVIWIIPFAIISWIYFDTSYQIANGFFSYRCAFIKGKIDIQKIKKVSSNTTLFSGIKPALATKGIVIFYNRFDEIYVAPENNEELIADLLKINPEIEVHTSK
ncbi:MAG: PH domain-containing protein [Mongoliitalea sp.]